MMRIPTIQTIRLVTTICVLAAPAGAQTFTTVHKFCGHAGCSDGANPLQSPLIPDGAGNFLGTAQNGGVNLGGVLYQLTGGAKYKKLLDFPAGVEPRGPLVQDTAGNLFGIAGTGSTGAGAIYELRPNANRLKWSFKTLYTFCVSGGGCSDGKSPVELTYAGEASGARYDGKSPLFGSTIFGGAHGDGTVFAMSRHQGQWSESVVYSFCAQTGCNDGMWPSYGLIADSTGNLYGTTTAGGAAGQGTVFELASSGMGNWNQSVLYSFCADGNCTDGAQPSGLVADGSGNLYGTTTTGGDATGGISGGVIYRLAPNGDGWRYARLYSFCENAGCADGDGPQASMIMDSAGTLFGTTAGDSRVFSYSPQTSNYQVLHSFCLSGKCRDGVMPFSPLTLDPAGNLIGNTNSGGKSSEGGTLFRLSP